MDKEKQMEFLKREFEKTPLGEKKEAFKVTGSASMKDRVSSPIKGAAKQSLSQVQPAPVLEPTLG